MQHRPARRAAVLALASSLLLAACAGPSLSVGSPGGGPTGGASPSASAPAPVTPRLSVARTASWKKPLRVAVTAGALTNVVVTEHDGSTVLAGQVNPAGTAWLSDTHPQPGTRYDLSADVVVQGRPTHLTGSVTVAEQPDSARMLYGVLPGPGAVVGVNAPIVIRFHHEVQDRKTVEEHLLVATEKPLIGSWHWINSSEVHFRPQTAWPAHSKVRVTVALDGVKVSSTRWGTRDAVIDFQIGAAQTVVVDDKTKTFTLSVDGKKKYVWPTSLGRPEYVTRTGNYIVLEHNKVREMTSCSAGITCDKKSPDYYDLQVQFATRLSWSGTFIHAAPWSVAKQGLVDSSHGCIHLTTDRAKIYFDLSQYGDLVVVKNTGRPIDDLVQHGDPGADDWNSSWSSYVAGSALGSSVTTEQLES